MIDNDRRRRREAAGRQLSGPNPPPPRASPPAHPDFSLSIGVCKNGPWDSLGTIAKGHGSEWIGAELAKIIALEKLSVG
jgi:hypothetical protein